jgi:hypothetical protein
MKSKNKIELEFEIVEPEKITNAEKGRRRVREILGNRKGLVTTEEIDAALSHLAKCGGSDGSF